MRFKNLKGDFHRPDNKRVLKWMLGWHDEKRPTSPKTGVPVPFVHNDGTLLKEGNADTLTWIGQASFLVQIGGLNILIDPVLSDKLGWIKRNIAPGLDWASLPRIDVILITHNHRDHMDAPTLMRLGDEPLFIVPKGLGSWFTRAGKKRVVEMAWWDEYHIQNTKIAFVPAQHWSRRGLNDINASWWGGYVVEHDGMRLYHTGDTGWFDGFEQIGQKYPDIHAAMMPIGAYAPRWFMRPQHIDPQEAVHAFQAVNAKHFVAMHWGTFKLSDEPLDEPPIHLREIWEKDTRDPRQLHIPAIGETLFLDQL